MVVLRVRGVRDSCVMVFVSGAYIETTDMFLPGNTSYGPRAMPHISLHVTLNNILYFCTLYILLRGCIYPPASHHLERPFVNPPWRSPLLLAGKRRVYQVPVRGRADLIAVLAPPFFVGFFSRERALAARIR